MTQPAAPERPVLTIPTPVWLAPLVILVAALGPWPYGYYGFLRMVVCASAAYVAFALLSGEQRRGLGWAFVGLALLYNPIFRVHLDRETWAVINLFSAAPYAMLGWVSRRARAGRS